MPLVPLSVVRGRAASRGDQGPVSDELDRLVEESLAPGAEGDGQEQPSYQWAAHASRGLVLLGALAFSFALPHLLAGGEVWLKAPALLSCIVAALLAEVSYDATSAMTDEQPYAKPLPILIGAAVGTGWVWMVASAVDLPWDGAVAPLSAGAALGTLALASLTDDLRSRMGARASRVFFIGGPEQYQDLAREVGRRRDLRMVAHLEIPHGDRIELTRLELVQRVLRSGATVLVMSSEAIRDPVLVAAASELNLAGLRVRTLHEYYEAQFAKVPLSELSPSWFLFDVAEIHQPRIYGGVKRLLESVAAFLLLVALAPVIIGAAILVKLEGGGPVLFRQERVGKHGTHFLLTKLRTMRLATEDPHEAEWATARPWRVTRVGALLRRFRLDELPQLWNVVCGQLSLVGPRPEQPAIVDRLTESIEFYASRLCVRPGLTGWAQVNYGYGGSFRGNVEKLQYDFFYIKRQNLRLDLLILAATVRTVFRGGGR